MVFRGLQTPDIPKPQVSPVSHYRLVDQQMQNFLQSMTKTLVTLSSQSWPARFFFVIRKLQQGASTIMGTSSGNLSRHTAFWSRSCLSIPGHIASTACPGGWPFDTASKQLAPKKHGFHEKMLKMVDCSFYLPM